MSRILEIHPISPQQRLIRQAAEAIRKGAVVVYPTDTSYAIGCHIGDKAAIERVRRIRQKDAKHNFAIMCRDLSDSRTYAIYDTPTYRLLKSHTPGPYTFVLDATREVPRRLIHPKKKTIGLRVPDHPVTQALLEELGEPLLTSSMILPGEEYPLSDPEEIRSRLRTQVDLIIDGGPGGLDPTTLISFISGEPEILRRGVGDTTAFE